MTQQPSMPQYVIKASDLFLKSNNTTQPTSNGTTFWTALEVDHTQQNYSVSTTTTIADTSKQTIASLTGQGVITQIVASALSLAGTMIVTVTIDGGIPKIFNSGLTAADDPRLCIGDFRMWQAQAADRATTIGGKQDQGFGLLTKATMMTPLDTIVDRNIYMVFQTSALIELEADVALESSTLGKAAVAYLNYLPRGIV